MKTTKKIISLLLALTIIFSSVSVIASAATLNDIESFEAYATRDLIEYYDGYWHDMWEDDPVTPYFTYDVRKTEPIYRVTQKNGVVFEGNADELNEFFNYSVEISLSTDDQYENPWEAGNSYTATAHLGSCSYTGDWISMHYDFEVNVVESPIASIEINEINFIENYDGYWTNRYNSKTDSYEEYFHYSLPTFEYTVTFDNGEVLHSDCGEIYYNDEFYYVSFSQEEYPLTPGRNEIPVYMLGYKFNVIVNVAESPVENVYINEINLIENSGGGWCWSENGETGEKYNEYFYYNLPNFEFTVTMKDGTILESVDGCIYYNDSYYYITYDQDYYTRLLPGRNEIPFSILGYNGTATINVNETPVESVSVNEIDLIENYGGHRSWYEDGETGERYNEYFYYYLPNFDFTVTMKDGTVFDSVDGCIYYNDKYYDITYDQNFENRLLPGRNEIPFSILGYNGTATINVNENPVESVSVNEINLIENSDGEWNWTEDLETGERYDEYFYYALPAFEFTVTMKDGTVLDSVDGFIYYNDRYYYITYDQNFENRLLPGRNEIPFSILGYNGTATINVNENPVESVVVKEINLIENYGGYWNWYEDWETGERYDEYFYYNLPNFEFTVTMKDGTVLDSVDGCIYYNDRYYYITYDQNFENRLLPGRNEIDFCILGCNGTATINVNETPIESIEIKEINLIENFNGWWHDRTDNEYYCYNLPNFEFTVTMKDGNVLESVDGYIEYNGEYLNITCSQSYENRLLPGRNEIEFNLLGYDGTAVINVNETPVESIEIDKITVIENTSGYQSERYNNETDTWESFFYYYLPSFSFSIKMKDGTEINEVHGFYYNDNWYSLDFDQWFNPLKYGINEIPLNVLGFDTTAIIEVIDTPIESIEIEPLTLHEFSNGRWEIGKEEDFFYYDDVHFSYTVTMKDGEVYRSNNWGEFCYNDSWYSIGINQYETPLHKGRNEISFELLGYKGTLVVNVEPSPIESVSVKDVYLIEGFNAEKASRDNPETGEREEYYHYYLPDEEFTVTFSDGAVVESINGYVNYNNTYYYVSGFSQYNAPLTLGVNEREFNVGGYKGTYRLIVEECPVADITIEPIYIVENAYGYYVEGSYDYSLAEEPVGMTEEEGTFYDEPTTFYEEPTAIPTTMHPTPDPTWEADSTYPSWETTTVIHEPVENYFSYYLDAENFEYTVTFKDGTVQTAVNGEITYNGKKYILNIFDNQHINHLTLGANTVKVSALGFEADATVNIIESPVKSISAQKVMLPLSSARTYDYEPGVNYFDIGNNAYLNIELNDGTKLVLRPNMSGFYTENSYRYKNFYYTVETDRYLMLPLPIGKGEVTVSFMGTEATIEYEVYDDLSAPYRYDIIDGGVVITKYLGSDCDTLEIPAEIDGLPVVGVAYLGYVNVNTLIIPDSVKYLSEDWLCDTYGIESLTLGSGITAFDVNMIPYTLKDITVSGDNKVFCSVDGVMYSKDMTKVVAYPPQKGDTYYVPESVSDISIFMGSEKFNSLYAHINVVIPDGSENFITVDGVTYSGDMTKILWVDPEKTGSYTMPDSVTAIDEKAFEGSALESISISPNVTEIVYATFADCASLVSVEMPASVKSIGDMSFASCDSLESIDLSAVERFGDRSFADCTSLNGIQLSDKLYEADSGVFWGCTALEAITIPASLTTVPASMFSDCTSLKQVNISEGVVTISRSAFAYSGIEEFIAPASLCEIFPDAFYGCMSLKKAVIDCNVRVIPDNCFNSCENLYEVVLGDNITHIKNYAFYHCPSIEKITLPDGLQSFDRTLTDTAFCKNEANKVNGITYMGNILISADRSVTGKVVIPEGVEIIAADAFAGNTGITEVIFPSSLRIINEGAFINCKNLRKLDIPDGLEIIGDYAFSSTALESLTLPASVTDIMYRSFVNTPITEVDMPEKGVNLGLADFDATPWDKAQSDGIIYLDNVLYEHRGTVTAPTAITIKDGTKSIASHAFSNEYNITSVTMPDSVEVLSPAVFSGCSNLESITLSKGLKAIDDFAFSNTAITEILLPEGLEKLGMRVFNGTKLTSIYIPASVSIMNPFTFMGCSTLESIIVDEDNPYFSSIDGILYNKDGTKVIFCPQGKKGTVTLSADVKIIDSLAFNGSAVQKIVIENPDAAINGLGLNTSISSEKIDFKILDFSMFYMPTDEVDFTTSSFFNPVTICAALNSTAHKYATAHGHVFEVYDESTAHTHSFDTEISRVEPGCVTAGSITKKCSCGKTMTEEIPAIGSHSYTSAITTPATCTTDGVKTFTCSACKHSYTEKIASAGGHKYATEITTAATCTTPGLKTIKCSACGDSRTEAIAATGHNYKQSITTPATCTTNGVRTNKCTNCSTSFTTAISSLGGHKLTWTVTKEPTVLEEGVKTGKCQNCSHIENVAIEKLPGIEVKEEAEEVKISASGDVLALDDNKVSAMLENLSENAVILTADNKEVKPDELVATGMKVVVKDNAGNVVDEKTIIVPGDVDCDGKTTSSDARAALRRAVGLDKIADYQEAAADLDPDNKVTSADAREILRASVGLVDKKAIFEKIK